MKDSMYTVVDGADSGILAMPAETDRCERFEWLDAMIERGWGNVPSVKIEAMLAEMGALPEPPAEPEDGVRDNTPLHWYQGREQSLHAWADELGVRYGSLTYRLRTGMDMASAVEALIAARRPLYEYGGEWKTAQAWAVELRFDRSNLRKQLSAGLTVAQAIEARDNRQPKLTYGGITQTLPEWARQRRIPIRTIYRRIQKSWSVAEVLGYEQRPESAYARGGRLGWESRKRGREQHQKALQI
ncbi:MAG TPA: hypothetical protein VM120_04415 [Bryobacteraceae bacterium]|nr:hypothetical protein [Bryobacteraceae bacterium]